MTKKTIAFSLLAGLVGGALAALAIYRFSQFGSLGGLADWLSGIGSILAVITALWIALRTEKPEVHFSMTTPNDTKHNLRGVRQLYAVCGSTSVLFVVKQKYARYASGTVRRNPSSVVDVVAPYSKTQIGGALKRALDDDTYPPTEVGVYLALSAKRYHRTVRLYMGEDTGELLQTEWDVEIPPVQ